MTDGSFFQPFTAVGGADNQERTLRNVIGVLPGANPQFKDEVALLTAHYDHLGLRLARRARDAIGKIHPGADDNASGVAVLIEVAKQLAAGPPPAAHDRLRRLHRRGSRACSARATT